jgi:hypothetical protein
MKLPLIGRRQETRATEASAPTIDVSKPRACWYQTFADHPSPCPQCGAPLHRGYQTYMIGTRRGRHLADSFLIGGDFGWFCPPCPTVVINPTDVSAHLTHSLPQWDVGTEFAMLGIVDLEAIPPDKQHLPLGADDNPIPLVEFTRVTRQQTAERSARLQAPQPPQHRGSTQRTSTGKKRHRR